MSIKYNYNRSGSDRKPLVEAISQMLDKPAIYQGAPSFSYIIGDYTVDRNGVLSYGSNIHPEFAAVLVEDLRRRGFTAENDAAEDTATEEPVADAAIAEAAMETPDGDNTSRENTLTIEMPKTGFTEVSLDNLHKIIAGKEALLKKALGADSIPVIDTGETLKFPWFILTGLENEADAYSRLVAAICKMAKERKRVIAKECSTENDKFTMRLFLVQLGFIGDEYKTARKILLRNLTGNSSWKSGHAPARPAPAEEAANTEPDPEPENTPEGKEGGGSDGK